MTGVLTASWTNGQWETYVADGNGNILAYFEWPLARANKLTPESALTRMGYKIATKKPR